MGIRRYTDRGQMLNAAGAAMIPEAASEPPPLPAPSSGYPSREARSLPQVPTGPALGGGGNPLKFAARALQTIALDVVQVSAFRFEVIERKANSMFDQVFWSGMLCSTANRIAEKRARELWVEKFQPKTIRRFDQSNKQEWS